MMLRVPIILLTLLLVAQSPRAIAQESSAEVPGGIAQLVIDDRSLEPFFHPEVPGRVPLMVSDKLLSTPVSLTKFGQAVVVKPDSELTTEPFLRFEDFSVLSEVAIVHVAYPIEGVVGRFILTRNGSGWSVRVADVWER